MTLLGIEGGTVNEGDDKSRSAGDMFSILGTCIMLLLSGV